MPSNIRLLDPLEALMEGPSSRSLRVGLALPMSGVLAMTGPSVLEAAVLAGSEVNRLRTTAERQLEFVLVDSGGPVGQVSRLVSTLGSQGLVEAFVGLHTSRTRQYIERELAGVNLPYIFTAGHENGANVPGMFLSGESPTQLTAGIPKVMRDREVLNWAIVGTNYAWPRAMRDAARITIERHSGNVVLDELLPFGSVGRHIDDVVAALRKSGAEAVVINMPGRELSTALLAIRGHGLDRKLIRYSGSLEENVLYSIEGDDTGNLYATQQSFESLASERRTELKNRYRAAFGEYAPVFNSWAERCYDGTRLISTLDRVGTLNHKGVDPDRNAGMLTDPLNVHPRHDAYLAIATGMSFLVL